MNTHPDNNGRDVIFVYDGECPICTHAALATRIRKNFGELRLIDARNNQQSHHPILEEIADRGLDLDEGMVIKYQGRFYHGEQALTLMAALGSNESWFNRVNRRLFKGERLSGFAYPVMRAARNLLIRAKGVAKINNLKKLIMTSEPIFKEIFGDHWPDLPTVFHKHYAPRARSTDRVRAKGTLNVRISPLISIMSRLTGALIPYSGDAVAW